MTANALPLDSSDEGCAAVVAARPPLWTANPCPRGVSVIRVQSHAESKIVPGCPLVERTEAAANRVGANFASGSV